MKLFQKISNNMAAKIADTKSIVTTLIDKAIEISDKDITPEELDAWNQEFNSKFFISNTTNSIVHLNLGFKGSCKMNFYRDGVSSTVEIDLNKVQFIDDIIDQVNKAFLKTTTESKKLNCYIVNK